MWLFNSSFLVLLFYQQGCTVTYGSSIRINAFIYGQTACGTALCASGEQCSSEVLRVKNNHTR